MTITNMSDRPRRVMIGVLRGAVALLATVGASAHAHDVDASAQYIANEGVMVESGDVKILFDPIFDNGFGTFPLVSEDVRETLMSGAAPFDGVDAVFVSHAHADHFAAADMIDYLSSNPAVRLIAPPQALEQMREDDGWDDALLSRIIAQPLDLNASMDHIFDFGDADSGHPVGVTRLRVPHIGGAMHEAVENMIYRVTLGPGATVMHLGDADADQTVFAAQSAIFGAVRTDMAFVPFWFVTAPGDDETRAWLNAAHTVGIHVPIDVPDDLATSGADYFSIPGERRDLQNSDTHKDESHE